MYYPYPPKDLKNHLKKVKRFHLVTSADIHDLVQTSALEHLMSVKEFIVQILINHLGRILEEDPFLFVKFREVFNSNPHAFRRPKETKTEPNPHNDKIIQWIRKSVRSHAKRYHVLVTEDASWCTLTF